MYYAVSIICGLILGYVVAAAKHRIIWQPYAEGRAEHVYTRLISSNAVNVLTLLMVFMLRKLWPFSFTAVLAATAVGLAVGGRLMARREAKKAAKQPPQEIE